MREPAAPPADTGRSAVLASKKASVLRNSIAIDKEEAQNGVKSIEDKTFYMVHGFWTDSEFDTAKQKPEEIEFGSTNYFDLVSKNAMLRKYMSVGMQVIVVFNGHCYKIVPPKTA